MTVVVIDYGAGNLRSAAKALSAAAGQLTGGKVEVRVSAEPRDVLAASRVVLPGVGAFGDCRRGIDAIPGLVEAMTEAVIEQRKPFLGICVGMQLMATVGVEFGETKGLDWIKGRVVEMKPSNPELRIPQMGWNDLEIAHQGHAIFKDIKPGDHAYFVHSFEFQAADQSDVLASVDYGGAVAAVIGRDNLLGVQFHPEKSQQVGLQFLRNFLDWTP